MAGRDAHHSLQPSCLCLALWSWCRRGGAARAPLEWGVAAALGGPACPRCWGSAEVACRAFPAHKMLATRYWANLSVEEEGREHRAASAGVMCLVPCPSGFLCSPWHPHCCLLLLPRSAPVAPRCFAHSPFTASVTTSPFHRGGAERGQEGTPGPSLSL